MENYGAETPIPKDATQEESQQCWVQCDRCQEWRNLPGCTIEEYEAVQALKSWTCDMNRWDLAQASCSQPKNEYHNAAYGISGLDVPRTQRRVSSSPRSSTAQPPRPRTTKRLLAMPAPSRTATVTRRHIHNITPRGNATAVRASYRSMPSPRRSSVAAASCLPPQRIASCCSDDVPQTPLSQTAAGDASTHTPYLRPRNFDFTTAPETKQFDNAGRDLELLGKNGEESYEEQPSRSSTRKFSLKRLPSLDVNRMDAYVRGSEVRSPVKRSSTAGSSKLLLRKSEEDAKRQKLVFNIENDGLKDDDSSNVQRRESVSSSYSESFLRPPARRTAASSSVAAHHEESSETALLYSQTPGVKARKRQQAVPHLIKRQSSDTSNFLNEHLEHLQNRTLMATSEGTPGERKDITPPCHNTKSITATVRWAQCDLCEKWRKLPGCTESEYTSLHQSSAPWRCAMNRWDVARANCSAPEEDLTAFTATFANSFPDYVDAEANSLPKTTESLITAFNGLIDKGFTSLFSEHQNASNNSSTNVPSSFPLQGFPWHQLPVAVLRSFDALLSFQKIKQSSDTDVPSAESQTEFSTSGAMSNGQLSSSENVSKCTPTLLDATDKDQQMTETSATQNEAQVSNKNSNNSCSASSAVGDLNFRFFPVDIDSQNQCKRMVLDFFFKADAQLIRALARFSRYCLRLLQSFQHPSENQNSTETPNTTASTNGTPDSMYKRCSPADTLRMRTNKLLNALFPVFDQSEPHASCSTEATELGTTTVDDQKPISTVAKKTLLQTMSSWDRPVHLASHHVNAQLIFDFLRLFHPLFAHACLFLKNTVNKNQENNTPQETSLLDEASFLTLLRDVERFDILNRVAETQDQPSIASLPVSVVNTTPSAVRLHPLAGRVALRANISQVRAYEFLPGFLSLSCASQTSPVAQKTTLTLGTSLTATNHSAAVGFFATPFAEVLNTLHCTSQTVGTESSGSVSAHQQEAFYLNLPARLPWPGIHDTDCATDSETENDEPKAENENPTIAEAVDAAKTVNGAEPTITPGLERRDRVTASTLRIHGSARYKTGVWAESSYSIFKNLWLNRLEEKEQKEFFLRSKLTELTRKLVSPSYALPLPITVDTRCSRQRSCDWNFIKQWIQYHLPPLPRTVSNGSARRLVATSMPPGRRQLRSSLVPTHQQDLTTFTKHTTAVETSSGGLRGGRKKLVQKAERQRLMSLNTNASIEEAETSGDRLRRLHFRRVLRDSSGVTVVNGPFFRAAQTNPTAAEASNMPEFSATLSHLETQWEETVRGLKESSLDIDGSTKTLATEENKTLLATTTLNSLLPDDPLLDICIIAFRLRRTITHILWGFKFFETIFSCTDPQLISLTS